jgi:hypothetical protein
MAKSTTETKTAAATSSEEVWGSIRPVQLQAAQANLGIFNLPPNFDTKKFAGSWIRKDLVELNKQDEYIPTTNFAAPGKRVWTDPSTGEEAKVIAGDGTYILMYRPVDIQRQVTMIQGNIGRERLRAQLEGKEIGGQNVDNGMLTHQRLARETGSTEGEDNERLPQLFPQPSGGQVLQPQSTVLT